MTKKIGYARVSTQEQDLDLQLDALRQAGCDPSLIFIDKASGAKTDRPGLLRCLSHVQEGDILFVWRIDRLGRSMSHLVEVIEDLRMRRIGFKSLCDGAIDTTSASGELIFTIFSAMAQFERRLIQERTKAGLEAARARGRRGGRKALSMSDPRIVTAQKMHENRSLSIEEICKTLKISKASFYRYLSLGKEERNSKG